MTADTVKSLSITNLDTISAGSGPMIENTAGEGAGAYLQEISDFVAATAAGLADTTSTYRMVRLKSTAHLKDVRLFVKGGLDSSTGLAVDLGAYYSDNAPFDGTPSAHNGASISAACFVSAVAFGQSGVGSSINGLSNMDANLINQPIWKQAGLSADPGGMIDLVLAVHTAKSGTASAGNVGISVKFTQ